MTAIEKAAQYVVDIFKAEEGYIEKATNAQLDDKTANAGTKNYTKYGRDVDAVADFYNGKKQGYDWCDVSHDWAHIEAWGAEMAKQVLYQPDKSCGAGCKWSATYYKSANAWYKEPKVGDQIFFGTVGAETHTGMVRAVDSKYVYTVEGNSGNAVKLRTYYLNDAKIAGYGRPNYAIVADKFEEDEAEKTVNTEQPSSWAKEACEWAVAEGIFAGDGKGNYGWQQPVTREQLAVILKKLA